MENDYLSVEEIAQILGLSEDTIRGYIRNKQLKAFRFGHVYRVLRSDFAKFVKDRSTKDDEDER